MEAVAETLPSRECLPIVLDPVLESSSGAPLMDAAGVAALRGLLPLVTPDLPEAARLSDEVIATTEWKAVEQARRIQRSGVQAVLLKGGHTSGAEAVDVLISERDAPVRLRALRVKGTAAGQGAR